MEVPPSTVEMLLATRLDHLDPRELHVLRRAAVLGRRFSRAELEDLGLWTTMSKDSSRASPAVDSYTQLTTSSAFIIR